MNIQKAYEQDTEQKVTLNLLAYVSKESADTGYTNFHSFSEIQHATKILKATKYKYAKNI